MQQRAGMTFYVKLKQTATETLEMLKSACSEECLSRISIVLYCIYSAFKTSMRRTQNIVNIQHTDNKKYIKFKVLNIIIKIKLKILN
jgi:hypothetical protein